MEKPACTTCKAIINLKVDEAVARSIMGSPTCCPDSQMLSIYFNICRFIRKAIQIEFLCDFDGSIAGPFSVNLFPKLWNEFNWSPNTSKRNNLTLSCLVVSVITSKAIHFDPRFYQGPRFLQEPQWLHVRKRYPGHPCVQVTMVWSKDESKLRDNATYSTSRDYEIMNLHTKCTYP